MASAGNDLLRGMLGQCGSFHLILGYQIELQLHPVHTINDDRAPTHCEHKDAALEQGLALSKCAGRWEWRHEGPSEEFTVA